MFLKNLNFVTNKEIVAKTVYEQLITEVKLRFLEQLGQFTIQNIVILSKLLKNRLEVLIKKYLILLNRLLMIQKLQIFKIKYQKLEVKKSNTDRKIRKLE